MSAEFIDFADSYNTENLLAKWSYSSLTQAYTSNIGQIVTDIELANNCNNKIVSEINFWNLLKNLKCQHELINITNFGDEKEYFVCSKCTYSTRPKKIILTDSQWITKQEKLIERWRKLIILTRELIKEADEVLDLIPYYG